MFLYHQHVLMLLRNSLVPVSSSITSIILLKIIQLHVLILCKIDLCVLPVFYRYTWLSFEGHFSDAADCLLSSPCIRRHESTFLSMYLSISRSDLSAIFNIKASVSAELNGNKREASIND